MDEFILKEIDLEDSDYFSLEEAMHVNLGSDNKAGICFIKIKGSEGPIPHFHIESKSNKKFYCCIKLYEADYFHHITGEVDLTPDQKKILNNNISVQDWKDLCTTWNSLNVNESSKLVQFENYIKVNKIDLSKATKPDYSLIP